MNFTVFKKLSLILAALILFTPTTLGVSVTSRPKLAFAPQARLPNPVLYFVGQELYEVGGKQFIRYAYMVANFNTYSKELFAASPDLPPCGSNTKASRTWVEIYEQSGKRLNGFCALGSPAELNNIWFALEPGVVPPSWIYIEMTDRKTNTKYKSNLADTTM